MRSSTVRFLLGLLMAGVLSTAFLLTPRGEQSDPVSVQSDRRPKDEQPIGALNDTVDRGSRLAMIEPASSTGSAPEAPPSPRVEDAGKGTKRDYYWKTLPDLDACLQRKDLNPDGRVCPSKAVRESLERLIRELNVPIGELAESRSMLISQIGKAKIAAGLDPESTWASYPSEMIIATTSLTENRDGHVTSGQTAVLKGDDPDLDALIEELIKTKQEAKERLKQQIDALCGS